MTKRKDYSVIVEYEDQGFQELDEICEAIIGKESDGSGFDFTDHTRDLEWMFKTKAGALNAFNKLHAARLGPDIRKIGLKVDFDER